jgi:hypothetical protein
MRDGAVTARAATFELPITVGPPTLTSHAATRGFVEGVASGASVLVALTSGATSVNAQMYFTNVAGLITCHFSTLSGAGVAPGAITTLTSGAGAIPAAWRPAAAYVSSVPYEFKLGTSWYAVTVSIAGTFAITRTPAWAFGQDLNFTGTMIWNHA